MLNYKQRALHPLFAVISTNRNPEYRNQGKFLPFLLFFLICIMDSQPAAEVATGDTQHTKVDGSDRSVKSTKEELFYSEKEPSLTSGDDEAKIEQVAEAEGLPLVVREIVSLEDRPDDVTITFRYG